MEALLTLFKCTVNFFRREIKLELPIAKMKTAGILCFGKPKEGGKEFLNVHFELHLKCMMS